MKDINLDITEILKSSKNEIKEAVMLQTKEALTRKLSWGIESNIEMIVADFFTNELKEEIDKVLEDSKELILKEIQVAVVASCAEMGKALVAKATKNVQDSWTMRDISKKLFD